MSAVRPLSVLILASAALLALPACAAPMLELSERETDAILAGLDAQVTAERAAALEIAKATMEAQEVAPEPEIHVPEQLTLEDALQISAAGNRGLANDREGLILSAVSLRNARRDVGLRVAGSVSYLLRGDEDAETRRDDSAALSLTDLLPTGGEFTLSGDVARNHGRGDVLTSAASGTMSARLSQPLLRNAGYESSHESLTNAERQALYDVRDFDLSRQDLALRVQSDFYGLVSQKTVIANRDASLVSFEFLKNRSEALFEVGRSSEVDMFRSRRELLSAENDLVDARQELEARLDRFKILLGLPTTQALDVVDAIPEPRELDLDLRRGIDVALANRLDLMTDRDLVEDAERRVRIAERDLLPDVTLDAVASRDDLGRRRVGDLRPDRDTYSVGVAVELPFDRVRERGALRRARIDLDRARRSLALDEDNVILQVRQSVRNLKSARNSLAIQEQIVASEEKNAKVTRLRFEQGEIGNRDLTDALNRLADARDRLVREKVNVETTRLQLLRDAGVLVIEEDGTWRE